jgi:hypothetical protein
MVDHPNNTYSEGRTPMPETPRQPALDYRKADNNTSLTAIIGTIGAAAFTFMGLLCMSLLSDEAWKLACGFSAFGLLFATMALRVCGRGPRRIVLWCIAGLAATFAVLAMLMRFNLF